MPAKVEYLESGQRKRVVLIVKEGRILSAADPFGQERLQARAQKKIPQTTIFAGQDIHCRNRLVQILVVRRHHAAARSLEQQLDEVEENVAREPRPDLASYIAFLSLVCLMPFSTSLLAEFITFRYALLFYWANILLLGVLL